MTTAAESWLISMRDAPGSGVGYPALAATADGSEAVVWVELPGLPAGSAPRRVTVNGLVLGRAMADPPL